MASLGTMPTLPRPRRFALRTACLAPLLALGVALAAALPARADSREWSVLPENPLTGTTGAAICPYEDGARGLHNCLSLECVPGEALMLTASVAGFGAPDHIDVEIAVDGAVLWDLRLRPTPDGRFARGLTGRAFAPAIESLQAGISGTVTFSTQDQIWRDHMSLAGSRKAIDAALSACWRASADPARDPGRAAREEVRAWCIDHLNRPALVHDGFLREEDLDGDGRDDLVVNYARANCGAIGSPWCGWAGCDLALHLSREGGFVAGFRGLAEGFRTVPGGVVIRRPAALCPEDHAGACPILYRATAEGFAPAGPAEWPGAADSPE